MIDAGQEGGEVVGGGRPRILLLDDDLVVVDKPAGMPSVPARTPCDPPDVATVLAAGALAFAPRVEAVHRLDRDTSGLLILARSRAARVELGRAFEAGAVEKTYLALVVGCLPGTEGAIHQPLGPDPSAPPRQRIDPIGGRPAATRWRIVPGEGLPAAVTAVELTPITGRSHQLRVHLAWLGCGIVGDRLYARGADSAGRLWLHASRIVFPHPRDGRSVEISAPLCLDSGQFAARKPGPGADLQTDEPPWNAAKTSFFPSF